MLGRALCLGLLMSMGAAATESGMTSGQTQKERPEPRLQEIFDSQWEYWMRTSPTWASRLGDRRYNDRWPDVSLEAQRLHDQHDREVLQQLAEIDPSRLSRADRLNYDLFQQRLADLKLCSNRQGHHRDPVHHDVLTQQLRFKMNVLVRNLGED